MIYYSSIKTPIEHYSIYGKMFYGYIERHRQDGPTYVNRVAYYIQGNGFSLLSMSEDNLRGMLKNDIL